MKQREFKAVNLALVITSEGDKGRAGLWIEQAEGASFWLKVMNELQDPRPAGYPHGGVEGLKGSPYAIGTVFLRIAVRNALYLGRHPVQQTRGASITAPYEVSDVVAVGVAVSNGRFDTHALRNLLSSIWTARLL